MIKKRAKPVAGPGLNRKKLGTIRRSNVRYQVTYAGFALYTYVRDKRPGQVKGEGVEKVWFAVSPSGRIVKAPA